jgi:tetraacyldisaccharide 4'-kinase
MKPILAHAFSQLATMRNFLYEAGFADTLKVSEPVISVGNLTTGGTGKTPIVDLILSHFEAKGLRVGLISRNYKARLKGTEVVDRRRPWGSIFYGDEPWMLAEKHPEAVVCVGPRKWFSLWQTAQKKVAQVFVVDDGFQHRALHRDLDIVLLDASADQGEYKMFPEGRAREPWNSLQRADIIVLTKTNLTTALEVDRLKAHLALLGAGKLVVETGVRIDLQPFQGKKVFAFAGLAKSAQFEQSLRQSEMITLMGFRSFPDHHQYLPEDMRRIEELAAGAEILLTTEKDFSKVSHFSTMIPLRPVLLMIPFLSGEAEFYARLDSVLK